MHSFYVPKTHFTEDIAKITELENHHLRNVLRMGLGDTIRIIDGEGSAYTAEICTVETEWTDAKIHDHTFFPRKTPSLTLFQSIPKHDKMELILQKTTELGVSQIVPILTERSLQKPSVKRCRRWQRIIVSGTKQCGRVWLPKLCDILCFEECLNKLENNGLNLIFWENEKQKHIKTVLKGSPKIDSIALIVGPEGGFSDIEVNAAIQSGCTPVSIGSNILRTETAAIAGIAVTTYEYEL